MLAKAAIVPPKYRVQFEIWVGSCLERSFYRLACHLGKRAQGPQTVDLSGGDEEGVLGSDAKLTGGKVRRENREISGCPWVASTGPHQNHRFWYYLSPIHPRISRHIKLWGDLRPKDVWQWNLPTDLD